MSAGSTHGAQDWAHGRTSAVSVLPQARCTHARGDRYSDGSPTCCHGNIKFPMVKMSSIEEFVVACEVGDLAWMRRCLRGGLDPAGRGRQVSVFLSTSTVDCVTVRTADSH